MSSAASASSAASPASSTAGPLRRWFSDRRVGTKIGFAVGACLVLMTVQGVNDLVRVGQLAGDSSNLYSHDAQALADLGDAGATINRMRQRVLLHVLAAPADKPRRLSQIKELDDGYDTAVASLRLRDVIPVTELDNWVAAVHTYRSYRDATILPASLRQVQGAELAQVLADCDRLFAPVEAGGLALSKVSVAHAAAQASRSRADSDSTRRLMVVLLLLGLVLALGLASIATRMIVAPLSEVRRVLDAVADGDLTQTAAVDSRDEPGQMAASLARATGSV
jgi:methyl-accepting chemotaxis protein